MKRNRITFIFLFILSIIFLYNFGGYVSSLFFYTLLSALLFSIAYTVYIYMRFKFVQDIDKKIIIKGEKVKLIVKLSNKDLIIYPFIYVSFFGSHSFFKENTLSKSLTINPLAKKEFSFDMECKYRGQFEIGISDIYIGDFLGLIKLKYRIPETKKINVYPKVEQLNSFDVFTNNNSDSQSFSQNAIEDVTNIKDLRNYNYGDSFKKIHWKLTARNNNLMIKNYQSTSEVNVNVFLDLRKNIYSDDINIILEDKLIEVVVAVLYYYLSKGIPANYIVFNDKIETLTASNQIEFEYIYNSLSSIVFNQNVSLSDIVKLHSESSTNYSDMIIFTSILDVALYNEIYNAQMSNHSICLVYISPKTLYNEKFEIVDEILGSLPKIGVKIYTVNPEDDIKTVLGGSY